MCKIIFFSFIMSCSVALTSCGDSDNGTENNGPSPNGQQFEDIIWSLTEYTSSDGNQVTLISDTAYKFRAVSLTASVDGLADCNASSGGSYQLNDGAVNLVFGPFEEAVCEGQSEQNRIDQNNTIEELLITPQNSLKMISYSGDLLVLTLPDGRSMMFRQVNQF